MNSKKIATLFILVLFLGGLSVFAAQDAAARVIKLKVSAEQANLREKPDIGSAVVQQIPEGTVLEADRKEGEWYLVRYTLEDGGVIAGYIHESLVTVMNPSQAPERKPEREPRPVSGPAKLPLGDRPSARPSWPESLVPIDVFLSAGGSTIVADDFNQGAAGLAGSNAALLGIPASGSVGALRLAYLLGFEVFYRISPRLSVGLGMDYLTGRRSSQVSYPSGDLSLFVPSTTTKPIVEAIPLKVGIRYYPRPDFYIRGSFAYYSVKAGYDYTFVASQDSWQEWKGWAKAHVLGMEVAVGGEWRIGPRLLFFSEAGFRLAQLDNFKGTDAYRSSDGSSSTEAGSLWYYQALGADGRSYNLLFVRSAEPSGSGILGARKAGLNLSGTILRAGVKFHF
ncbi:MAG: SH3 domain-containing protein [Candidatus Aminicenantales bacterium]